VTEAAIDVLRAVEEACLDDARGSLSRGLGAPPPHVHIMTDNLDASYVGCVGARPYEVGEDAVSAVTGLALLPAAVHASRLLLVWEEAALCTSLYGPGDHPYGLALVTASATGHVLRWYPFRLHGGNRSVQGQQMRIEWRTPSEIVNAELPSVMESVLRAWRCWRPEPEAAVEALVEQGYLIDLLPPPDDPARRDLNT
jgi:hypothetical protein